jgi:Ca2+-binding RTX toxin-like protein
MRTGRSYVATALALGIITLSGCAAETSDEGTKLGKDEDWGDENKYPELGGAYHSLTAFAGTCSFASGLMTVTATSAQSIIVGKRAVDSAIVVNGALLANCTTVTSATVKQIKVVGSSGNDTLIIDFLGGTFAPGIAAAKGIVVDLAGGTDEVRVRGTSAVDNWVFGSEGATAQSFSHNTDAFRDIDFANVESYSFATAGGNDVFTGTVVANGLGAGKGVTASAAIAFTLFGGDGNDVLTGGDKGDKILGGEGADTLAGGGGASTVVADRDRLFGEAGADVITQGDANNGRDDIYCGTEAVVDPAAPVKDTVSYALRGTTVVRDATNSTTIAATDGERVLVTLADYTGADTLNNATGVSTPDGIPDDLTDGYGGAADGYPDYDANDGQTNEALALTLEKDSIAQDCEIVVGGADNDLLTGSVSADTVSGGAGDDTIVGGMGDDVLSGDDGDDLLDDGTVVASPGTTGADTFNGGLGTDTVSYLGRSVAGVVVSMNGTDPDDGQSAEGDDVQADVENLVGTDLVDTITGNDSANVIYGKLGADILDGGKGNDTFSEDIVANGGDIFTGGAGVDTVDYSKRTDTGVWVTMAGEAANDGGATQVPVRTATGTLALILALDVATPSVAGSGSEGDNVGEDVENVIGTQLGDDITGNDLDNNVDGGAGADYLFGGLGNDTLYGGSDFSVSVTDGNDFLYGGAGDDTLDGGNTATSTANKLICNGGTDTAYNQGSVTFVSSTGVGAYRDPDSCES